MTWTFDANAPQVSDFQEGKIVFATGRAVGRVLSLNRQGDTVKVILGPVQLTDVIRNGNFEMNENIDLNNMISYVAPDYPQPPDPDDSKTSFQQAKCARSHGRAHGSFQSFACRALDTHHHGQVVCGWSS